MKGHMIAFFLGYVLDLLVGDPYFLPHPIRLIGKAIGALEKKWNQPDQEAGALRKRGTGLVICVLLGTLLLSGGILFGGYLISPYAGVLIETVMTYQILATKCLKTESMKVYRALKAGDLSGARNAVSMIVGRDTDKLDEIGIAKAAVETVAENTSDGVIAPMLCLAIGGPVLGFFYKAVNTMDSMLGYKNERYLHFGHTAAKLDDIANFLPARISAFLMTGVSFCFQILQIRDAEGRSIYDGRRAWRIYRRDRRKHASPNSAQTEAVCAGSLGIRLAGDASYFGKTVKKPYIGDSIRRVTYEDIRYANALLYGTAWLCEGLCIGILILCMVLEVQCF